MQSVSNARQWRGVRHLRMVMLAVGAVVLLALPSTAGAIVYIDEDNTDQLADFDVRDEATVAPTAAQKPAASGLAARITWNNYGTPGSIFNQKGWGARDIKAPTAAAAARVWVNSHKSLLRTSASSLELVTQAPLRGTKNDHAVVFRQSFGGVLSLDNMLSLSVVGSAKAGWKIAYVSSSLVPSSKLHGKTKLSPLAAWTRAARAAGHPVSLRQVSSFGRNANGSTNVIATGFMGDQAVSLASFGTARGAIRAYRATVTKSTTGSQNAYDLVIDATTGKVLARQNTVFNATDNPTWKAPEHSQAYNNMNAFPWNYPTTDNRVIFCWNATAGCVRVVSENPATTVNPSGVSSKMPWDVQATVTGFTGTADSTQGNNVDDARVWSGSHTYGSTTNFRATSTTRDYQPAFTDAWYTSGCNPNTVNAATNPTGNDIEASTVSLFVGHNVMHDWAYDLGFDEGHWNAQQFNNGVTTNDPTPPPGGPTIAAPLGNDGLIGNAQSGAASGSRDNANMGTGADGTHSTTNQFVWQSLAGSFYAPCVDGAYDFAVFGHEFGHLIENRMIGKGVGARQGTHAGSMGEAFGDFDALAAFNELHLPIPTGSTKYTEGAYATGNGYNGIRDFLAGE